MPVHRTQFNGYSVAFSPFLPNRIAVATSQVSSRHARGVASLGARVFPSSSLLSHTRPAFHRLRTLASSATGGSMSWTCVPGAVSLGASSLGRH